MEIPKLHRNMSSVEIQNILLEHRNDSPLIVGVTDYETTVDKLINSCYSITIQDIYVNNPLFASLPKEDDVYYILIEDFELPPA